MQLQRWALERVSRGKLPLRCHLLGGARRFGAHGGGGGRGHIVAAARIQRVLFILLVFNGTFSTNMLYCAIGV